jgi:hypothetical protein
MYCKAGSEMMKLVFITPSVSNDKLIGFWAAMHAGFRKRSLRIPLFGSSLSLIFVLLPKCPICLFGILTATGINIPVPSIPILGTLTAPLLLVPIGLLCISIRGIRSIGPMAVALAGGLASAMGKWFDFSSRFTLFGTVLIATAFLWNAAINRKDELHAGNQGPAGRDGAVSSSQTASSRAIACRGCCELKI